MRRESLAVEEVSAAGHSAVGPGAPQMGGSRVFDHRSRTTSPLSCGDGIAYGAVVVLGASTANADRGGGRGPRRSRKRPISWKGPRLGAYHTMPAPQ